LVHHEIRWNVDMLTDPERRFVVIIKDGLVYKNILR